METLYLLDGHALIYAAYYAPLQQNLTAPNGEATKAVYIFTTMLLKLLKEHKPDRLAVAMDSAGKTFRHEMYRPYKANRPAMPADLIGQIRHIEEILEAMHIATCRVDGYEADDIIGTLAARAARAARTKSKFQRVVICSKDKDLEQLLNERVVMLNPQTGEFTDPISLQKTKGISPAQVIDILTLTGDTSDNIPGVPDVGPKTALQWIQTYGSLANLLEHQDQIKGKRGDNLRAAAEQLTLSRRLVTIDCAVPLECDWDDFSLPAFDRTALAAIFQRLGFRKLLGQLNELAPPAADVQPGNAPGHLPAETAAAEHSAAARYHLVDNPEALAAFLKKLQAVRSFALDTETTGINPVAAELVGMSFAWRPDEGYYLPLKAPLGQPHLDRRKTLAMLKPILTDPAIAKTGQNIKYDMVVLRRAGIELAGVQFDTMVASYVLYSNRTHHNLDSLARDFLGHETIKLEDLIGKGKNQLTFDLVDTHIAADYAAEDAVVTWRLREHLAGQFAGDERRRLFATVEMPLVEVLADMEYQGVALDIACLKKLSGRLAGRLEELIDQIHQEAGCDFNVDSPKQLAAVLFDTLGLQPAKKTKTGPSTDQSVLEQLSWQHPVARLMLEYRELSKLKNTYVDKLPSMIYAETGRIHASFNQTITATGRLSSSNPNLQNIPIRTELGRQIRRAFVAGHPDSVLLSADYSQIELRLLAHFSRDEGLLAAFAQGRDIHRFVASQVYGLETDQVDAAQRGKAKAVNFGIIYGQTPFGLSRSIGIPVEEARRFIDDYFRRYPRIQGFIDGVIAEARRQGYVQTILGRRRSLTEIDHTNASRRRLAERMAVNTVVQGSAADLIKMAMIRLFGRCRNERLDMKMILQIHDELVFEIPAQFADSYSDIIREEMISALPLEVPIQVDIHWAPNWLDCK
ncbi:MAG: DNA polymerase I [Sedimentisphaerales bacterium]|nr:DNA polymerase I [Sedimentisphaerales bacterium]